LSYAPSLTRRQDFSPLYSATIERCGCFFDN